MDISRDNNSKKGWGTLRLSSSSSTLGMCFDRASEAATSPKPCWNVVLFQKVWWQHLHSDTLERWCTSPLATACIISILLMRKAKPPGLNYRSRNQPTGVSACLAWLLCANFKCSNERSPQKGETGNQLTQPTKERQMSLRANPKVSEAKPLAKTPIDSHD